MTRWHKAVRMSKPVLRDILKEGVWIHNRLGRYRVGEVMVASITQTNLTTATICQVEILKVKKTNRQVNGGRTFKSIYVKAIKNEQKPEVFIVEDSDLPTEEGDGL